MKFAAPASVKSTELIPPLKWHGGKHYLAAKIVALMPPHLHYVEPFFGGGRVLFARDPDDTCLWFSTAASHRGVSELVNDIDRRLINFWRVLRDPVTFEKFRRAVEAIPLARAEWEDAHRYSLTGDAVADAVAFFVDARQSRAANMKGFTSITRTRTRRGMNGNVSEWLSAVDGLPDIHARLRRVAIENMPAVDLICREDGPQTLFYCDPPYLHETRSAPNVYAHEMTEQDHRVLLTTLIKCKGKVILSGYASELYDRTLAAWNRHTFDLPNNVAGGKEKERETEVVWCNF